MATRIGVTGGNGFIGSWIVKKLLERGYLVRALVRDPGSKRSAHLRSVHKDANSAHLEIVRADLSEKDYLEAFPGCEVVIHTASPYFYTAADPEREIVAPAIAGTMGALNAARACGVRRVVVTSSGGAFIRYDPPEGYKFTAQDWNTWSSVTNNPYFYSKRRAEESAWEWSKRPENKAVEVVVVNPLYVLGPTLGAEGAELNSSLKNARKLLMGDPTHLPLNGFAGLVDVRDVADAHIIAATVPAAAGQRLFCVNRVVSFAEIPATLKRLFPQYPVVSHPPVQKPTWSIDNEPLAALGLRNYVDVEQMLHDMVVSLQQSNTVPNLPKQ